MFLNTCRSLKFACLAAAVWGVSTGCTAPQGEAKKPPRKNEYEEGWLFNRLTGREDTNSETSVGVAEGAATPTAAAGGVTKASYDGGPAKTTTEPVDIRYPSPDPRWDKDQDKESSGGWFSTKAISDSYKKLTGDLPNHVIARQSFAEAEALFRQAKYAEALPKYQAAGKKWRDSPLEEDALFFASECAFQQERYNAAADMYGELLKKYSNSRHLDKIVHRLFFIAQTWEKLRAEHPSYAYTPNFWDKRRPWLDPRGYALATWDTVRMKDPTGPLADDAIMAEGNVYFLLGRYEDADYYYSLLRKDYPKSEHQVPAHLLGLQAKIRKYQGPDYDGQPLKEASELVDQMLKQFPRELNGERERLLAAKTQVRGMLADRDWQRAEYYAKSDHNGAAKIYYNQIIKEYPQSNYAQLAQQRLGEMKGKPDYPDEKFAYMTRWFENKNDPNTATARANAIKQQQDTLMARQPDGTVQK